MNNGFNTTIWQRTIGAITLTTFAIFSNECIRLFGLAGDMPTIALIASASAIVGFLFGFRGAIISIVSIAGYRLWLAQGDYSYNAILAIVNLTVSGLAAGYLQMRLRLAERARQAEAEEKYHALEHVRQVEEMFGIEALEKNLARLKVIEEIAAGLDEKFYEITPAQQKEQIRLIWDRINGIRTLAEGWKQMGRDIKHGQERFND
jgi:hypothetical protein